MLPTRISYRVGLQVLTTESHLRNTIRLIATPSRISRHPERRRHILASEPCRAAAGLNVSAGSIAVHLFWCRSAAWKKDGDDSWP
jgi:hypothetical protein